MYSFIVGFNTCISWFKVLLLDVSLCSSIIHVLVVTSDISIWHMEMFITHISTEYF
jgi:hypothetical protein